MAVGKRSCINSQVSPDAVCTAEMAIIEPAHIVAKLAERIIIDLSLQESAIPRPRNKTSVFPRNRCFPRNHCGKGFFVECFMTIISSA